MAPGHVSVMVSCVCWSCLTRHSNQDRVVCLTGWRRHQQLEDDPDEAVKVYWFPITQANQRGYGRVSLKLPQALQEAGVEIIGPYDYGWDYLVMPTTPFAGPLNRDGSVRQDLVVHTMFDADFLPWRWAHVLNRCGAV